jgi:hypothetical protein
VFLLALFSVSGAALGQSSRDSREENQRLRTQVEDLQKELDAARARIAELETRVQELAAGGGGAAPATTSGGSASVPPPPDRVTIDETQPLASPRALLKAVIASHDEAMGGQDAGRDQSSDRAGYMRKLEGWVAGANRQFKGPIEWTVDLKSARHRSGGAYIVTLQAVDPVTRVELGDRFEVELDSLQSDRLARLEERDPEFRDLVLRGTLEPIIRINNRRETRRVFEYQADRSPFVGPFVELAYQVHVKSLAPAREDGGNTTAKEPSP